MVNITITACDLFFVLWTQLKFVAKFASIPRMTFFMILVFYINLNSKLRTHIYFRRYLSFVFRFSSKRLLILFLNSCFDEILAGQSHLISKVWKWIACFQSERDWDLAFVYLRRKSLELNDFRPRRECYAIQTFAWNYWDWETCGGWLRRGWEQD